MTILDKFRHQPEALDLRLADNENPLGVSPLALQSARAALENGHRYDYGDELTRVLAEQNGVVPQQIVLANGSSELLDTIARLLLGPETEAIASAESFGPFQHVTQLAGAELIRVPTVDFQQDIDSILKAVNENTQVVWFANPNNPSGLVTPDAEIKRLLEGLPEQTVSVLDEAYRDFLPPEKQSPSPQWLDEFPNLIITRSFSKSHGLAGIRIGYALTNPHEAASLKRTKVHLDFSSIAVAAALGAAQDHKFADKTRQVVAEGREQIIEGLVKLGIEPIRGEANFVTFPVDNSEEVREALARIGILVRSLGDFGLRDYLRVSVSLYANNWAFLQALRVVLNDGHRALILEPDEALAVS